MEKEQNYTWILNNKNKNKKLQKPRNNLARRISFYFIPINSRFDKRERQTNQNERTCLFSSPSVNLKTWDAYKTDRIERMDENTVLNPFSADAVDQNKSLPNEETKKST